MVFFLPFTPKRECCLPYLDLGICIEINEHLPAPLRNLRAVEQNKNTFFPGSPTLGPIPISIPIPIPCQGSQSLNLIICFR